MKTVEIHSLYYPDTPSALVDLHKRIMAHLNLPVIYTERVVRHGVWMDLIMNSTVADVCVFLDIDCIVSKARVLDNLIQYALKFNSFIGPAQSTNCIKDTAHVFASPACLVVSNSGYRALGNPTFLENGDCDVAQNLSRTAERNGIPYRAFYPYGYQKIPDEGAWRLGNYGTFGIGTIYFPFRRTDDGFVFHLYQGRKSQNISIFITDCP